MKRLLITGVLTLLVLAAFGLPAFSAPDAAENSEEVETFFALDALQPLKRPVSQFMHDEHNEKAGLEDCNICHHVWTEDGKLDPEDSSEGTPCSDCHALKAESGKTSLVKAYHLQCKSCHERKGTGPRACGECHVN